MAHTYMKFDFGTDEEAAQQARHKLEVWKQAFRLDKKLQYKLDRGEETGVETHADGETSEGEIPAPAAKGKSAEGHGKRTHESKGKEKSGKGGKGKSADDDSASSNGATVTLLVRLYFSSHEKLSEQRMFDRIPAEEPFKSASPQVIREGDAEFAESEKHFSELG